MKLAAITPVILTYNEEPNIGRVLERLDWARDIVVVDSFSTDATLGIVRSFPTVRLFQRAFDGHDAQWRYAVDETAIATEWVLTLDADYLASERFVAELAALDPEETVGGYECGFRFCIHGRPLRRSLYPPRIVLFRRARGRFWQDGHTQRVAIDGAVRRLTSTLDLDDRKPIAHWVAAQARYARLERDKLRATPWDQLGWPDRLRTFRVAAPVLMLVYCLVAKRMLFAGEAGWYYTFQRVTAEILLSLYLIEDGFAATPVRDAPSRDRS